MLKAKSEKLFAFNFAVFTTVIFSIYLLSPLRQTMEKPFYVIKSYLASYIGQPKDVVIVGIDEADISTLEKGGGDLSYQSLDRILQKLVSDKPRTLSVLLHSQVFKNDDTQREELFTKYALYSHVFFGVFDQSKDQLQNLRLDRFHQMILPAGMSRQYREEIVRSLPVISLTDIDQQPYLIAQVSKVAAPDKYRIFESYIAKIPEENGLKSVMLKYYRPEKIRVVSASDVLSGRAAEAVRHANVVVGYTVFRNYNFRVAETTYANTPFQFKEGSLEQGTPLVNVIATAIANLTSAQFARQAPSLINALLVVVVGFLCWWIWVFPIQLVFFVLFLGLVILVCLQAFVLAFLSYDVPTADAAMVGFFVTFTASMLRAKREILRRVRVQEGVEAQTRLLDLQKGFLGNMSSSLIQTSKDISNRLLNNQQFFTSHETTLEVYANALASAQEFEDYLGGIQQFLSVQTDAFKPKIDNVHLNKVVDSILKRFSVRLQAKHQKIIQDLTVEQLKSDANVIDQILHNLVSNAIKYSPENTEIKISSQQVDSRLYIAVSDQGGGIAAQEQEKIFEKFYRVKDDNVYRVKGTGLGLYLSRYFARQLGGDVVVRSEVGQGSTFTLILRLK